MGADILRCVPLSPSIMMAALPQLILNDLPLTDISVSSLIDLEMCASEISDAWDGDLQVSSVKGVGGPQWQVPFLFVFMVYGSRSPVRVRVLSFGGCIEIYPATLVNLL